MSAVAPQPIAFLPAMGFRLGFWTGAARGHLFPVVLYVSSWGQNDGEDQNDHSDEQE